MKNKSELNRDKAKSNYSVYYVNLRMHALNDFANTEEGIFKLIRKLDNDEELLEIKV